MRSALLLPVVIAALAAPVAQARPHDFDGDGRQDAVLGMPGWSPGGAPNAGAVAVLSHGGDGDAMTALTLVEGTNGLSGTAEGDDAFGVSATSGDFDADGFADLAVAAPGDDAVFVVPGHRDGLQPGRTTVLPDAGELLAADLDRDGHADLVVGVVDADPLRDDDYGAGRIDIYSGGPSGIGMTPSTRLRRPRRDDDAFGAELAVGDVDGDGRPDLVEGSPGYPEDTDGEGIPGHLSYCPGGRSGPVRCRALGRSHGGGPVALVIADVDGDHYGDVISGHPVNGYVAEPGYDDPPGAVRIWRGSSTGPRGKPLKLTQDTPGVPGRNRDRDEFGAAVASTDLDGDAYADLVIGAPGENEGRGRVTVVRGGRKGHASAGNFTLQEGRAGVPGARGAGDRFGHALGFLAFDAQRRDDLVVGAPGDPSLTVVYDLAATGAGGAARVTPSLLGMPALPEPPDALPGFGSLIAAP